MNNQICVKSLLMNFSALSVFKNFLSDNNGASFLLFLESINNQDEFYQVIESYTDFISELYNSEFSGNWSKYVKNFVLSDENPVSRKFASQSEDEIPAFILSAFEYELRILSDIAGISTNDIKQLLISFYPDEEDAVNSLPSFESDKFLFTKDLILKSYKENGYGIVSKYHAFKYDFDLNLKPVLVPDDIKLDDLKLYDYQKNTLKNNTLSFLKGNPANNVLLYGDRGCGKSSLVKAVCFEYAHLGLKIIQIYKENLGEIESLTEYLSNFPSKFILFIDDLVFDENDPKFASSKAVLEGSLQKRAENILIYATTNRRHLVKESFSSRQGDEIHINDTLDETASLADRFGITIIFSSPDKNNYLEIVKLLAEESGIKNINAEFFKKAEAFSLLKGNRAPRVAKQFLSDFLANEV